MAADTHCCKLREGCAGLTKENKQQIVAKHMDALLKMEGVSSAHNTKGLRHLYDLVESHVLSLKSLGVTSDSTDTFLTSVLLSRLPDEL